MEEKIKIYIPENIYTILLKDMELFEFFKKDHSFNLNAFFNTLVINYYQSYNSANEATYSFIKDTLANYNLKEYEASDIAAKITNSVEKQNLDLTDRLSQVTLSVKPTKASAKIFDYITTFLLHDCSLSNWFRNMLASYTRLPQDKREQIIFKENYDLICQALEKNKKLYFTNPKNNNRKHIVAPYCLSNSKEELFNYLLCKEDDSIMSFRLTHIKNLSILNNDCLFSESDLETFRKMIKYGPQYSYEPNEETIIVKLTPRGQIMYEKIYLHRPPVSKIENDLYYFDCSANQAMTYFRKFGKHVNILAPTSLRQQMINFHYAALKSYPKENK